jgi:hypothetical protein
MALVFHLSFLLTVKRTSPQLYFLSGITHNAQCRWPKRCFALINNLSRQMAKYRIDNRIEMKIYYT